MKKFILALLILTALPVSSINALNAQSFTEHFKAHITYPTIVYGSIGAALGASKGLFTLLRDKKSQELPYAKKALYMGRCALNGFIFGALGGAYISAILKNCQHHVSPEMSREQMTPPSQSITIRREALEEYCRINNRQCRYIFYQNDIYTVSCAEFLDISPNDKPEEVGKKYRNACREFHPDGWRGKNHTYSEQIICAINNAAERLKHENRF